LQKVLQQDYIKTAPVLILMAADKKSSKFLEYDLAIASGFIMIQAAALGLGTVWKHIAPNQRPEIQKILNLTPKLFIY